MALSWVGDLILLVISGRVYRLVLEPLSSTLWLYLIVCEAAGRLLLLVVMKLPYSCGFWGVGYCGWKFWFKRNLRAPLAGEISGLLSFGFSFGTVKTMPWLMLAALVFSLIAEPFNLELMLSINWLW